MKRPTYRRSETPYVSRGRHPRRPDARGRTNGRHARSLLFAYPVVRTRRPVGICFGDHTAVDTPVPIPNTEVKHRVADGTAFWWESRSLPEHIHAGRFFVPGRRQRRRHDAADGTPTGRSARKVAACRNGLRAGLRRWVPADSFGGFRGTEVLARRPEGRRSGRRARRFRVERRRGVRWCGSRRDGYVGSRLGAGSARACR